MGSKRFVAGPEQTWNTIREILRNTLVRNRPPSADSAMIWGEEVNNFIQVVSRLQKDGFTLLEFYRLFRDDEDTLETRKSSSFAHALFSDLILGIAKILKHNPGQAHLVGIIEDIVKSRVAQLYGVCEPNLQLAIACFVECYNFWSATNLVEPSDFAVETKLKILKSAWDLYEGCTSSIVWVETRYIEEKIFNLYFYTVCNAVAEGKLYKAASDYLKGFIARMRFVQIACDKYAALSKSEMPEHSAPRNIVARGFINRWGPSKVIGLLTKKQKEVLEEGRSAI